MISLTKIKIPAFRNLISIAFFATILFLPLEAYCRTNQNVNRVRPQEGTSQYVKEASRVRLLKMGEELNLSEEQFLKLRKARMRMEQKCDKEIEKVEKARLKYEKEVQSSISKQSGYINEYESEVEKILTPEQLEGYKLLKHRSSRPSGLIEPSNSQDSSSPSNAPEGGVGPIIKAEEPPIMY
ncbi:MAG: hypothetical protein K2M31_08730 [Muribaculaceae bacterium]|nr:hypothetical protein [Muribaculaceae bacterium]